MKYVFRCDSSYKIGTGHLIRCINLAKQLDGQIHFICRTLNGNLNSLVSENQFTLHEIESNDYEAEQIIEEIHEITPLLKKLNPDCTIVDHYGLNKAWEQNAIKLTKRLLIIDDLARDHINSAILDQNYRKDIPKTYQESNSYLFLGPSYCLLNRDFQQFDINKKSLPQKENIAIFFGGSDPAAQTLRLVKILKNTSLNLKWNIIVGGQNKNKKEIQSLTYDDERFIYHENIDYMCQLMSESYLFIGAGGTTSWERARVELPTLCISIANNQVHLAKNLHEQGSCIYLGGHNELSDEEILQCINKVLSDESIIKKMQKACHELSVGNKIEELIDYLKGKI